MTEKLTFYIAPDPSCPHLFKPQYIDIELNRESEIPQTEESEIPQTEETYRDLDNENGYALFWLDCPYEMYEKKALYEEYRKYCHENDIRPSSREKFYAGIKHLFEVRNGKYRKK
ncbi:hypothetical protein TVAG_191300 [Trichomonas vaginalis G3]|uniref:DNA primase/nucleoside triphosphatase C-terminal domain-containing protein n=1 Tax=Trichomonas vaginalis (strain ATCC PRA-98 / G3) TaxID=412133 RepID=A2GHN2_TRIV3|nr:hypothetical protein TVAGG3_0731040 [Trichomonas vaginalis G3]XP_053744429.1 uncharacterized protein TVAGG3_1067780 [Trichomonas vaginalis G3]EAX75099.1 hypothetical protein TVAG_492040 [Trichomonas vaginalis G3]EAX76823.1 hypothetical protein TVAG_082330 [Trichomonas vaginalis G3]EAX83337.1 hypothetical protein TVAG_191300 [Trichomonas vaginalis G3]KAI5483248.1 hypothetical protein TVAGG3_1067780 [Trichomonas vaginalis G3]KAI5511259.1 hypothetical protein TVAGG3_0731040 [Trichomonas vagin|eukprot:XP_001288029.1 hypothetical protein [Trichomonas vaginalis G3]